ncbi:MAG: ATP-binding protein [Promicromonosporaceae bacterium]|nr:ATP-binding protein [Promicromonosporaceae bacterium]
MTATALRPTAAPPGDASLRHVLGRLAVVEERVRALVAERRAADHQPDDPYRGLYLSDEAVDRILADPLPVGATAAAGPWASVAETLLTCEVEADDAEAAGERLALRDLTRTFGLDALDVELLLIALAPEVDPRFERLYGYLNDDVTRRRPSAAVALGLCGLPAGLPGARARLLHGPLADGGLVELEDPERPLPGRALRVPDRVAGHLLGDPAPDPALAGVLADPAGLAGAAPPEVSAAVARALAGGLRLLYLRRPPTGSGRSVALAGLEGAGRDAVVVDLARVLESPEPAATVRAAVREARLRDAGLVAEPVDALVGGGAPGRAALSALVGSPATVLMVGETAWDATWAERPVAQLQVRAPSAAERTRLWTTALGADAAGLDVDAATAAFRLRPEQVLRAAGAARAQADLHRGGPGPLTADAVRRGARAENGTGLDRLARRVEPAVGWDDLVLPALVLTSLREVSLRARHRERVLGDWRMRPGGGRGHGVVALFAGDSGTGKTMSAEVVAADLGLDLYVVDLAAVVDKYVGETEKNLERIFDGAAGVNAVLLFDEADAVFGRRSEVKDAHDRYANIESAYLLQRLESFDGLVVLATNLRANLDEAFTRRLDVVVDFPLPDAAQRRLLWDRCLGSAAPRADDVDLDFCARFELAGGAIRSAAVGAAYLAADDGGAVGMRHLVTAVHREYRKLGRLTLPGEFGEYWELVGA